MCAHLGDFDQARPNSMTPALCSRNSVTMTRCAPYAGARLRLPANRRWPEQKRRLNERGRGVARADLEDLAQ